MVDSGTSPSAVRPRIAKFCPCVQLAGEPLLEKETPMLPFNVSQFTDTRLRRTQTAHWFSSHAKASLKKVLSVYMSAIRPQAEPWHANCSFTVGGQKAPFARPQCSVSVASLNTRHLRWRL